MKYRKVGKSGLKISELSLGTWLTFGGKMDDKTAKQCINTAIEQGINFIDTAEIYARGGAERIIGEWLAEETVDRNRIVLSSKVFWPTSEDVNDWGLNRKNIMNAIEGTLERLGTDHIDIYFMHRFDHTTPLQETVEVVDDLIHSGMVHYWGTSVWTAAQLERVHAITREIGAQPPIVEQPRYNMLFRHIELEIMQVASDLGMGFTVWSPLAMGILTGKYNDGIPEDSRASRSEQLRKQLTPELLTKLKRLAEIAASLDITMGQLSLAWILQRKEISAALIGVSKPEHVIENTKASDVKLSSNVLEEIEEVLDNRPKWPDTYEPNIYYEDRIRY